MIHFTTFTIFDFFQKTKIEKDSKRKKMGKLSDYEVVEEIGTGTFGTCCKIRRVSDGQPLVWKQISYSKMNEAEKEALVREVNLLRWVQQNTDETTENFQPNSESTRFLTIVRLLRNYDYNIKL